MATDIAKSCVPRSILDTDLYKCTMQEAVLQHFPTVQATYRLTLRDKSLRFTTEAVEIFKHAVSLFSDLALTPAEREWLESTCGNVFAKSYIDYLAAYRYKPEQVHITFTPLSEDGHVGTIEVEATGPWTETIMWEVPLMACLSEVYFNTMDTDWDYDGQEELAFSKGKTLIEGGCVVAEFGTRRRRSYRAQDIVMQGLLRATKEVKGKGGIPGTSNIHLAHKYAVRPIGTVAHEWFMGIGALDGYLNANKTALDRWEQVFPNAILLALTDTFSSEPFFKTLKEHPEKAHKWHGLRQDSGDPFAWTVRAKEVYESMGINPGDKSIIYSDSLNVDRALELQKHAEKVGFKKCSFGIGTFLTNDFKSKSSGEKSKAMNMVIKLASVDGRACIKISDDLTKNTGDPETVLNVKRTFGLPV